MKAADLREKSVEDLRELQKTLARDVFQNRLKNFTNRLDDTSSVRKSRRDLARVITVLKEQALGVVRPAAAAVAEATGAEAPKPKKKAAPKAEAKSAPAAEAKPKKTAAKKSSAKADKKSEAK
jgi:large subunit ribosomal protein L29